MSTPTQDQHTITQALEEIAEREIDITDAVYEHFFALYPDAAALMSHSDELMRGRMLEQTLMLLMDADAMGEGNYLRWEVDNHLDAYGVLEGMYPAFLESIRLAMRDALDKQWLPAYEQAWQNHTVRLLEDISQHAQTKTALKAG